MWCSQMCLYSPADAGAAPARYVSGKHSVQSPGGRKDSASLRREVRRMAKIELVRAQTGDAERIHEMKYRAFLPLFEKYQDEQTSPAMEKIEKVIRQLQNGNTDYYLIKLDGEAVGAIRAVRDGLVDGRETMRISPLFVLPEFQGQGAAHFFFDWLERQYPAARYRLETEHDNLRAKKLYTSLGYKALDYEQLIKGE